MHIDPPPTQNPKAVSQYFRSTTAILILGSSIVFLVVFIHLRAFTHESLNGGADISKGWDVCVDTAFGNGDPSEVCKWKTDLPDTLQTNYRSHIKNRIEYRNSFLTPKICLEPNQNGCVFIVGGVYQGATVVLNGHALGSHFSRSDIYPASFKIPATVLMPENSPNYIKLQTYSEDLSIRSAVVQGPIAVVGNLTATRIFENIVGERVALPLMSAITCLVFALMALFWMLSQNASHNILKHYLIWCLATAIYMINATRIPRELLSYNLGFSLNFCLRYLMDLSLFNLVVNFFSVRSPLISFFRKFYYIAIAVFGAIVLLSALSVSFNEFLASYRSANDGLVGLRHASGLYLLACLFTPLMLGEKLLGLVQSLRFSNKNSEVRILLLLFSVLVPMQIIDVLTFLGLIRFNHEVYYMRLYTPFIAIGFGYAIWMQWLEKERSASAFLKVGETASSVAHDLKSPISVLRVLLKSSQSLTSEDKELLSAAIQSIDKTTSGLLSKFRSSRQKSSIHITEAFEVCSLVQICEEVLKSKNYVLKEAKLLEVQIDAAALNSKPVFCKLQIFEFKRAIDNLVNNSIDAVKNSPKPSVVVKFALDSNAIIIDITDSGPGFEEYLLRKFNRHDFGKSTKATGHGIGLAQIWAVIQRHSGHLVFKNNLSQGATVQIRLPMAPNDASSAPT